MKFSRIIPISYSSRVCVYFQHAIVVGFLLYLFYERHSRTFDAQAVTPPVAWRMTSGPTVYWVTDYSMESPGLVTDKHTNKPGGALGR